METQHALTGCKVLRRLRIFDRRFCLQNFIDTFCRDCRSRQHDGHHGQHQERHDDHHRVGDKSSHRADLHVPRVNLMRSEPDNRNGQHVHNQHHAGHHEGHHAIGKEHGPGQRAICLIETFFFFVLTLERADDRKSGKDFPGNKIQSVNEFLHEFKLWHGR